MIGDLAQRIDQRTPADRDRYFDFLRAASIMLVVIGHWSVRVVTVDDGQMQTDHLLNIAHWTHWLTPVFQVMPVFFIVGAVLNVASWRRAMDEGVSRTDWTRKRARRLLRPMIVFLLVVIPIAVLISILWGDAIVFGADFVVVPLWFLAAYLIFTALTPLFLHLHKKVGGMRLLVGACLLTLLIDLLSLEGFPADLIPVTYSELKYVNFVLVWPSIYLLGVLWADGKLPSRAASLAMLTTASIIVLLLMLGSAAYPVSFIPTAVGPNNSMPPTAALFALSFIQLGLLLLARDAMTRVLEKPRAWAVVAIPGSRLVTIFLWHQAVIAGVAVLIYPTGLWPTSPEVDAAWYALRVPWLLVCGIALVPVVMLFGRFESASEVRPSRLQGRAAVFADALGIVLIGAALVLFIQYGVSNPDAFLHLPLLPILLLLTGLLALGVVGEKLTAKESDGGDA